MATNPRSARLLPVRESRNEAKAHGGEVILLHVVELSPAYGPETTLIVANDGETPIGMRVYAIRSATEHLDLAKRLQLEGVEVTTFVRVGKPVDEILRFSGEHEADVIVMGTHGRTGLAHLIAGSVAERIVRGSSIPVMTIRHE